MQRQGGELEVAGGGEPRTLACTGRTPTTEHGTQPQHPIPSPGTPTLIKHTCSRVWRRTMSSRPLTTAPRPTTAAVRSNHRNTLDAPRPAPHLQLDVAPDGVQRVARHGGDEGGGKAARKRGQRLRQQVVRGQLQCHIGPDACGERVMCWGMLGHVWYAGA